MTDRGAGQAVKSVSGPAGGLEYPCTIHGINEPVPGRRWQTLFDATWSRYRQWYLSGDATDRPDLRTATRMLERYMPELMPTCRRLVALTGGDEVAARMLTLWNPPRFSPGCSQLVLLAQPHLAPVLRRPGRDDVGDVPRG